MPVCKGLLTVAGCTRGLAVAIDGNRLATVVPPPAERPPPSAPFRVPRRSVVLSLANYNFFFKNLKGSCVARARESKPRRST